MVKKISLTELLADVIQRVTEGTGTTCYDTPPINVPSPLYYAELAGIRPENTKTMFCEVYTVLIHAISKPTQTKSREEIYDMIQKLEEAMTEYIDLPEPFKIILQTSQGLSTIKIDETNEWHAVMLYDLKVCYGFMTK